MGIHQSNRRRLSMQACILPLAIASSACSQAPGESSNSDLELARASQELQASSGAELGQEVGLAERLAEGDEQHLSIAELLDHGRQSFRAVWTRQEGGGRPLTKGTGTPLVDPSSPLLFPRNFNRVSAPDANACSGCHNAPFAGGGGDIVANVFVLGQRFDFATFESSDLTPTRGAVDENLDPVRLQDIANSRATLGMNGSGYIEMLARQMTADLQAIRDSLAPGETAPLITKGVDFGELSRHHDGTWDTTAVEGLPAPSLASASSADPPNLILRPFHQAGAVISLRQFTNNAFNHHHGIQANERFGDGLDPDGDGFVDELNRTEVTATTLFQATLSVPGRVIPRDPEIEQAVWVGEQKFAEIGCADCHRQSLPLDDQGWVFEEPNPYNPEGNLRPGDGGEVSVDLNSVHLPGPRLKAENGVVQVPAYTDLKLHDITTGPGDPHAEPLNMHFPPGSAEFHAGNTRFLTKKLWGAANEPPFFHHGKLTTLREAILAHAGEAQATTDAFKALSDYERDAIIEFLKSLQVLPDHVRARVVDERHHPRPWPPKGH